VTIRSVSGAVLLPCFLLTACNVGPRYVKPSAIPPNATAPTAYKETPPPLPGWTPAQPDDAALRGNWWEIFGDPTLNSLEAKIAVNNQNLKAAAAQYDEARQQVKVVRANLFPTITAGPQASRNRESQNHPLLSSGENTSYTDLVLSGGFNYQVDLWGQIRKQVAQAREQAQASAAQLANVNLSMHALLASSYYQLRALDTQTALLAASVDAFEKSLQLTLNRFHGGVASELDVAQARTQLETTRAALIDVGVGRAQTEHAIAVLVGETASTFSIAPAVLSAPPPVVPPGMPSALVERRPDIAGAERTVAAANEQIGIARAAYFPNLTLAANGGFESTQIGNLITGPSALWSVGASAIETIFDAGRRRAQTAEARDQYDQQVAQYRQTTLVAFQQVEDSLAAIRILQQESVTEEAAVAAAQRSLDISLNRYKGGLANYIEVLVAQASLLSNQRTQADVLSRRFIATVQLVQALGGGWDVSQLPHS
jgi:NodT family efflux transporter outer membrane factor (OMF) lipoprotein